jgi:hypothetical protein
LAFARWRISLRRKLASVNLCSILQRVSFVLQPQVLSMIWTKRISGFFRANGLIRFRFQFPKLFGVRLFHQTFVVALDDVRAVAGPRSGFALVLETGQMI